MRILLVFASLLAAVYATALTYRLEAHEKACFFAQVGDKGTKVAFYFAVGLVYLSGLCGGRGFALWWAFDSGRDGMGVHLLGVNWMRQNGLLI